MHLTQKKTKSHQIGAKDYKDCFIITKKYHLNYAFNHHLTHIYIYITKQKQILKSIKYNWPHRED